MRAIELRKEIERELRKQKEDFKHHQQLYLGEGKSFFDAVSWGKDGIIAESLIRFCEDLLGNVSGDDLVEALIYMEKTHTRHLVKLYDCFNSTSPLANAASYARNQAMGKMVEFIARLRKQGLGF